MAKPEFYKSTLTKIKGNVLDDVYSYLKGTKDFPTMEERLGDAECPECPKEEWVKKDRTRWMLLPDESVAVSQGGKEYIECLNCGYVTHL